MPRNSLLEPLTTLVSSSVKVAFGFSVKNVPQLFLTSVIAEAAAPRLVIDEKSKLKLGCVNADELVDELVDVTVGGARLVVKMEELEAAGISAALEQNCISKTPAMTLMRSVLPV